MIGIGGFLNAHMNADIQRRNVEIYTKWLNEERERKAGMSKFKVGDTVWHGKRSGVVLDVGKGLGKDYAKVGFLFGVEFLPVADLSAHPVGLIDPEPRKFKVGDKVRVKAGRHAGLAGVVSSIETRDWYCAVTGVEDDGTRVFLDGAPGHDPNTLELIEPAHQGPVRTVTTTRKEIVPGKHGPLTVSDYPSYRRAKIQVEWAIMDKSQLYSLAADIRAMADALESGE